MNNATVRSNVKIGSEVLIVLKEDQKSGKLTRGTVKQILTNSSNHSRGIKVMLTNGMVGRVQKFI
ncbi:MAG: YwbE family protein [Bacilli bacterium]